MKKIGKNREKKLGKKKQEKKQEKKREKIRKKTQEKKKTGKIGIVKIGHHLKYFLVYFFFTYLNMR